MYIEWIIACDETQANQENSDERFKAYCFKQDRSIVEWIVKNHLKTDFGSPTKWMNIETYTQFYFWCNIEKWTVWHSEHCRCKHLSVWNIDPIEKNLFCHVTYDWCESTARYCCQIWFNFSPFCFYVSTNEPLNVTMKKFAYICIEQVEKTQRLLQYQWNCECDCKCGAVIT